jgi:septal ring factor EnvC (AmiA/AmiB activator)
MRIKRLNKKIQRLEARLQKGAKKLASLKQKLKTAEAARLAKTRRKRAARAREALIPVRVAALQKSQPPLRAKTAPKPVSVSERTSINEVKKKRHITPERRAQLSAAMKARWAAKRAAAAAPQDNSPDQTSTPGETPQQ